jgi:hypothetical protein
VSSIKPDGCGSEVYGGQEVSCGFVVAGGDRAELFDFGEEVLDQVACFVEVTIVIPRPSALCPRRDHRGLAGGGQRRDDAFVGVKSLVSDQRVSLHRWQEVIGPDQIMGLPAGQEEAHGIAQRIDQGVDFRAQPAARAPDRLVLAGFFWAPALC